MSKTGALGPQSSAFSVYELIHVGVFDIPRSPSLSVIRWAGRTHTHCASLASRGLEGLPRRAGWGKSHTVAAVGYQFPAAAAVAAGGSRDGMRCSDGFNGQLHT